MPLTKKMLRKIGYEYKKGPLLNNHPFKWNSEKERPDCSYNIRNSWKKYVWYFNILLTAIHNVFVVVQCVRVNLAPRSTNVEKIYMGFATIYFSLPFICNMASYLGRSKIQYFVLHYLDYAEYFEETYIHHSERAARVKLMRNCGLFLDFIQYNFSCVVTVHTLNSIFRPHSPELISSAFLDPVSGSMGWTQRVPFVLLYAYYLRMFETNAANLAMSLYTFPFILLVNLKDMKERAAAAATSGRALLHNPRSFFLLYRSLQLQVGAMNDAFAMIMPAHKWLIMAVCVLCTYVGVRMDGLLALGVGLIGLCLGLFIGFGFNMLAEIHQGSTEILRKKRGVYSGDPWARRMMRSSPVLATKMRSYYDLDKKIIFILYKVIFDSAVNLLILF